MTPEYKARLIKDRNRWFLIDTIAMLTLLSVGGTIVWCLLFISGGRY